MNDALGSGATKSGHHKSGHKLDHQWFKALRIGNSLVSYSGAKSSCHPCHFSYRSYSRRSKQERSITQPEILS